MSVGLFGIFGILALAGFVLWIWALVDALSRPDQDWERAGQNKLIWVLVLIFLGFIGAIVYVLVARPALIGAGRR